MKTHRTHLSLCVLLSLFAAAIALPQPADAPIDFQKVRQLLQRQQRGDKLTAEEQAYLERAKAQRAALGRASAAGQRKVTEALVPLCDLGAEGRYAGEEGGLYGAGRNAPPEAHRRAAEAQLARVQPLDDNGEPSAAAEGKIGLVALSMSNATQEFSVFKRRADGSSLKSPRVVIVDCAQGGQAMAEWAPPDAPTWTEAARRLKAAGVSPKQVQVAWVKLANKAPTGSLQEHGRKLERDTLALLHNARARFPNLRVVYLGSRTYGGYAIGPLNPEPYAYESAFAARWLIQRQVKGDPELAEAKAPVLLWGPYLWADGEKGRKLDSLVWRRADFGGDGVHPSDSGREKVATLLLDFFTKDPLAKGWFVKREEAKVKIEHLQFLDPLTSAPVPPTSGERECEPSVAQTALSAVSPTASRRARTCHGASVL